MKSDFAMLFSAAVGVMLALPAGVRGQVTPVFTTVHSFSVTNSSGVNSDGAGPLDGLTLASDGNFYGTASVGGPNSQGMIFKLALPSTLTGFYAFSGPNGSSPQGDLIQGTNGDLYGVTSGGGSGVGTLFEFSFNGALSTIYNFLSSDGAVPHAGLIQGANGNFFGVTSGGGLNSQGTAFQLTPAGVNTFVSFNPVVGDGTNSEGVQPTGALVQGPDGNFYGTAVSGGANASGSVFRFSNGVLAPVYAFSATSAKGFNGDGAQPVAGLALGNDGNFYGTASHGGPNGTGTVFRVSPAGAFSTLHPFSATSGSGANSDGSSPNGRLLLGSDGNFYGTTSLGGANGTGTVFQITPTAVFTTLHTFTSANAQGFNADGAFPFGSLTQGADGTFYGTAFGGGAGGTGTVFSLSLAPVFTSPATATGRIGQAFIYQITATNAPSSFGAAGLPAGLSVNTATGLLSGTPTASGTFTVTLAATNGGGTGSAVLTLTVAPGVPGMPVITSAKTASGQIGVAFSYQITATNNPTTYGVTGLPAGLSLNANTGLISGTPTTAGTSSVLLVATNAANFGNTFLTLTILPVAPVITGGATASGVVGQPFSYQITASDNPTGFGVVGLPAGLSVDTGTGVISGTPTAAGSFTLTLTATNSGGTGSLTLTLTITLAALPTVNVATAGDGMAVEGGGKGKVFFTRTGTDLSAPLTVFYKVKGSAKAGVDFKELPGSAIIPAGASKVKVKLKPIDNDTVDGTRKAKIKLLPANDNSYLVGNLFLARVKVIDND